MLWNPSFKPRLRPLEAMRLPDGDDTVVLRDPGGLSDVVLSLSTAAVQITALMTGANTCEEIRKMFQAAWGQSLPVETLQRMLEHLENAHFLEGPDFESHYRSLLAQYRDSRTRGTPNASALGEIDDGGAIFAEMLADVEPVGIQGRIVGLIAPHLDYPRGRPCYADAYATLRDHPVPHRVVILGTNHFGRSTSVVATANSFVTPLGTTATDVDFLDRLEKRCGFLRTHELDHKAEHSIELQVAWLQYFFGAGSFVIVPFLCPDPCGPTGTAPIDGRGIDLSDFAGALAELVGEEQQDTLLIAGADLSHVGAQFGDPQPLDDDFLEEVRRRDQLALEQLEGGDETGWLQCVCADDNPTRVCSAGCIFVLVTALPDSNAKILRYHQAVDQSTQTCVTCAAVSFIRA